MRYPVTVEITDSNSVCVASLVVSSFNIRLDQLVDRFVDIEKASGSNPLPDTTGD